MTYETAFKKLKDKFNNVDASLLEDMALQITLSDEDCGGTFYAEVKNHVLSVEPYDYKDNDAVLDVDRKTLTAILDAKTDIEAAIENGTLTVKGNLEKLTQIRPAIKVQEKKPAVKKTTVKKAAQKSDTKETKKKTTAKKAEPKEAPTKKAEPKEASQKKTTAKKTAVKKA